MRHSSRSSPGRCAGSPALTLRCHSPSRSRRRSSRRRTPSPRWPARCAASTLMDLMPDFDDFVTEASRWLQHGGLPDNATASVSRWGEGSDAVPVFDDVPDREQRARLDAAARWHRRKLDAGYALLTWPVELGGRGLPPRYQAAFNELEASYCTPTAGELVGVSVGLIARTVGRFGTARQQQTLLPPLQRMDELACQLFS